MDYEFIKGRYVFWNKEIIIPFINKSGKKSFFKKEIPFEEADSYWEYVKEEHGFSVYYIKKGVNRRLAVCNLPEYIPESICAQLHDGEISSNDCRRLEEHLRKGGPRIAKDIATNNWCIQYEGRSILELLAEKPSCTYEHAMMVIQNEGGFVDDKAVIHRGTAKNIVVQA